MSKTTHQTEVRFAIKDAVESHEDICVAELITAASQRCDCREADVQDQLDLLERHGFIYLTGDSGQAEVRLP